MQIMHERGICPKYKKAMHTYCNIQFDIHLFTNHNQFEEKP